MKIQSHNTQLDLSAELWSHGIGRLAVGEAEIPFLIPALTGHHFFTGAWPPSASNGFALAAVDYEPVLPAAHGDRNLGP